MNDLITHRKHSNVVRGWNAKRESLHTIEDLLAQQTESFSVKSPVEGFTISVTFSNLKDHPEKMRVSSSNWAAEYEQNAIFSKTDCRAFYKKLIEAGFVAF